MFYCILSLVFFSVAVFSCQEKKSLVQNPPIIKTVKTSLNSDTKMVLIKGGSYLPFYGTGDGLVSVPSFLIDEKPVTNREFLAFVKLNPQWRKSNVKRVYADSSYLTAWPSDLELPKNFDPEAPICQISWFAAKAYAESVGKRLPTLDEWEFVAMADEKDFNAREKSSYSDYIVAQYLVKDKQLNPVKQTPPNAWGVYNIFDSVWEWTDDFNSIMILGDSREGQNDDKNLFCVGGAINATDVLNYAAFMRFGLRSSLKADYTVANLGFRCAKDTSLVQL